MAPVAECDDLSRSSPFCPCPSQHLCAPFVWPADKWSPALQIRTVLLSIQALLSAPNPDDPLANDVAEQWKSNEAQAIETGEPPERCGSVARYVPTVMIHFLNSARFTSCLSETFSLEVECHRKSSFAVLDADSCSTYPVKLAHKVRQSLKTDVIHSQYLTSVMFISYSLL